MDQYLDALLAHDPHKAPFACDVTFTENGQKLELGDGLWRTFTAKGTYRMFVDDVEAGHVAFLGSIREADAPAMLALHLRVRDGKITAVETLVQRNEKSGQGFEEIGYTWRDAVPAGERMSRADLLKTANMYFSGMQQNDGKGYYPFDEDCNRIENGGFTTNVPTPPGQTRPDPEDGEQLLEPVELPGAVRIRTAPLRVSASGIGASWRWIRSAGWCSASPSSTTWPATRAPSRRPMGGPSPPGPKQPWTWEIAEAFQIEHGKIHQIQAIMERVPYGMNSGWSTWEEGMSSAGRDASR